VIAVRASVMLLLRPDTGVITALLTRCPKWPSVLSPGSGLTVGLVFGTTPTFLRYFWPWQAVDRKR